MVFMSPRCGPLRYARKGQKTARCFKCRYRVPIDPQKIRIVYKTDRRQQAIAALQELKMRRGMNGEGQNKLS